jgi:PAS domain S-box-containing protein
VKPSATPGNRSSEPLERLAVAPVGGALAVAIVAGALAGVAAGAVGRGLLPTTVEAVLVTAAVTGALVAGFAVLLLRRLARPLASRFAESETRLEALLENASDVISIVDADGTRRYQTPSVERVLGYRPEELVGKSVFNLIHPDDLPRVTEAFRRAVAAPGSAVRLEYRARHRDGSWRVFDAVGRNLLDVPAVAGGVVTSHDITDRVRAAAENAQLAELVEFSTDAIVGMTADGIITRWNPGAERLFGYPGDAVKGRSIALLLPPDDPAELSGIVAAIGRGERVERQEAECLRKGGARVRVSLAISPIRDASGAVTGAAAIAREGPSQARDERLQRDLVAMLSHDIKNPLSVALGFIELLRDEVSRERRVWDLLDRIETSSRKALTLAINFVDASRIESGLIELSREEVSLNEIVVQVLRQQASVVRSRAIALETALAAELPPLSLDRRQIDRVVVNLVSNAIKFSPDRGRVRVETEVEEGAVVLRVQDHGPGVPPKERDRLFEPYKRGHDGRVDGSGLGLFIVKTIVEAHGGHVGVEFPPEGGSRFTVSFDVQPLAAMANGRGGATLQ